MTNKKKKQTDERKAIFIKTMELDDKLKAKIASLVLNLKKKGMSILIIFAFFLIIALLIALFTYLF